MKLFSDLKDKIQSQPFFSSPLYLRYQHLVVPGVVLVVAILISVLVTGPQLFKVLEAFKTIEDKSAEKSFYQQKIATLSGIDTELYRKNLDTALLALPVDKNIPGVTGELLVALSGSGMTLDGITFSGADGAADKTSEYTLRMEVSGSEESLESFMERVKLSPRIVKLTTIDVNKARNGNLTASISFVALYQPLPNNIGTVDQPVPEISEKDLQTLADIKIKADAQPQIITGEAVKVEGKSNPFVR